MEKSRRTLVLVPIVLVFLASLSTSALATHEVETRFLDTFKQVDGGAYEGINSVNGAMLSHSLGMWESCDEQEYVEFNLRRDWTRLTSTVGLDDDDTEAGAQGLFEIYEDGQLAWSQMVSLGQSVPIDVDVSNTLRVRLAFTGVCDQRESFGVFGSASISRPLAHRQERSVTLILSEHLRAEGVVDVVNDVPECAASMRVKIQRYDYSWKTVAETTTSASGVYSITIRDRRGKYRAVALNADVGAIYPEHVCLKAKSSATTHSH